MLNVKKLMKELKEASNLYYNKGKSNLSDKEFDKRVNLLRKVDPQNSFLTKVGAKVLPSVKKIKLRVSMGSLVKLTPNDISHWMNKVNASKYIVSPKLDGSSVYLEYKDGVLIKAATRGDGEYGQDITEKAKFIQGIVNEKFYLPGYLIVKGEVFVNKSIFKKFFSDKFRNPRNFVAGLLNRKFSTNDIDTFKKFTFAAHSMELIDSNKEFTSKLAQLEFLSYLNFTTVARPGRVSKFTKDVKKNTKDKYIKNVNKGQMALKIINKEDIVNSDSWSKQFIQEFTKLDIETDGLVIEVDNVKAREKLGNETNSINPVYARAIKLEQSEQEFKIGTVKGVEWNYSKSRTLKPVVVLKKELDLKGVMVSRVSAFNAKFVKDYKLQKGTKVKIIRSGDVIPYLVAIKIDGKWKLTKEN